ncbi:MAG: hypothetical protein IJZ37_01085 [Clostridia bacterium]|nr:hypothetical protein [Clostridia bacterium]MBQ8398687.1 hypothetical protein [Clostridia bacterium]
MKKLVILGAGGYGRMVKDVARQIGDHQEIYFLDDHAIGEDVIGKCSDYQKFIADDTDFYPAFGNNSIRMEYIEKLEQAGANIAVLIHPTAYISPQAQIKAGVAVLPGAIVNTGTVIEKGCIVNCNAIVDHDCIVEKGVHVCLGAIIKAENRIPAFMKIEAGEVVENRKYSLNGEKDNGH